MALLQNGNASRMTKGVVSPPLRNAIMGYTGFDERFSAPICRLETPAPVAKLIVCFKGRLDVLDLTSGSQSRLIAFAAGFGHRPILSRHEGQLACIEIELNPPMAAMVLGNPLPFAGAGMVELAQLWEREADNLTDRLANAVDWPARFAVVDEVLLRRTNAADRSLPPEVAWAWRRLAAQRGRANIWSLADEIGWSGRHFSVRFKDAVGMTPKMAARLLRFDHAREQIVSFTSRPLAHIADACGYSDQSHMTREFRWFAGCSPAQYRGALDPAIGGSGDHLDLCH